MFNLENQVAIVTGCNTGLGQGMALGLAKSGCNIVGLNRSLAPKTQEAIEGIGRKFINILQDISEIRDLAQAVQQSIEAFGKVDILVNNAGIIRREDAVHFSENDWDEVMDINLKSTFFLSQIVANYWINHQMKGKIINIASMLSFQGGIRVASYTASKSGVMGLTRLMSNEWAKYGINVNAIAPGYMVTNNTEALRADKQRNQEILARIPAGRWGNPDDLAGPVVFLASSASDYVQGYTLAVDGGWLAR